MPCFHPLETYKPDQNGQTKLVFEKHNPTMDKIMSAKGYYPMKIPCRQCSGCRLEHSRKWAMRCLHEAEMHDESCFITLTFNPQSLNDRENPWSTNVADFQKFMKRLRKKTGKKIRFFHCGEYGEECAQCGKSNPFSSNPDSCQCTDFISKIGRPHYHAILFGHDFDDKQLYKVDKDGKKLYTSNTLHNPDLCDKKPRSMLWPFGFASVADVTFESCAYVARYVMKKITGEPAKDHYTWIDDQTGEIYPLKPEYTTMSRRPGIGKTWFDQFQGDIYPHDFCVVNGVKCKPPKYYDTLLEKSNPFAFDEMKENREIAAKKLDDAHIALHGESNNSQSRLRVREKCFTNDVLNRLPRNTL